MTKDELKKRVLDAKLKLPKRGVTNLFFHQFEREFKRNEKNLSRLNNVLQLRVVDEEITIKLEKLVSLLNNK